MPQIKPNQIIPGMTKVEGGYFIPDNAFVDPVDPENGSGLTLFYEIFQAVCELYDGLETKPTCIEIQDIPIRPSRGDMYDQYRINFRFRGRKGRSTLVGEGE